MNRTLALLAAAGGLLTASPLVTPAIAQRVTDVNPGIDTTDVTPDSSISGLFAESPVDPNAVQIFLNDTDVTAQSTITPNFFSYKPTSDLPAGENTVRVVYPGSNDQQRTVRWTFSVQPPQTALEVDSVTHNAASEALGSGATLLVTINGTPGAQGSVLLVTGPEARELTAEEVSPGVYVATLPVAADDNFDDGVAIGQLSGSGEVLNAAAPQPVQLSGSSAAATDPEVESEDTAASDSDSGTSETAAAPDADLPRPSFTSHSNGDRVSGGFTLVGETEPNATVEVQTSATRAALGGFVNIGTENLVDTEVQADDSGRFSVQIPSVPTGSGTQYAVEAVTISDGARSETTRLTLVAE